MSKQTCDPRPVQEERALSLSEQIDGLRRRQTAVKQLIDSLTAYAEYAVQGSDLTYGCQSYDHSRVVAGQ
jgi:hypothetical protein